MPTVPSTLACVSDHPDIDDVSGPTPDPELDDVVLVPAEHGSAVTTSAQVPPEPTVKPRLSLGNLTLHSPSSIIGTPFDISPRFEYPFPPNGDPPEFSLSATLPTIPSFSSPGPGFPSSLIYAPLPQFPIPSTRSSTHIRLQTRDPPMPPGLAKKQRAPAATSASSRAQRSRRENMPLGSGSDQARTPEDLRSQTLAVMSRRASLDRKLSDETMVGDGEESKVTATEKVVVQEIISSTIAQNIVMDVVDHAALCDTIQTLEARVERVASVSEPTTDDPVSSLIRPSPRSMTFSETIVSYQQDSSESGEAAPAASSSTTRRGPSITSSFVPQPQPPSDVDTGNSSAAPEDF